MFFQQLYMNQFYLSNNSNSLIFKGFYLSNSEYIVVIKNILFL